MNPTLKDGDALIAVRWIGVNPGDVIAFYYNNQIMLKRVIAKAGDWVNISEDGTVYVNDPDVIFLRDLSSFQKLRINGNRKGMYRPG